MRISTFIYGGGSRENVKQWEGGVGGLCSQFEIRRRAQGGADVELYSTRGDLLSRGGAITRAELLAYGQQQTVFTPFQPPLVDS